MRDFSAVAPVSLARVTALFVCVLKLLFFGRPIYYPRATLALPPSSNSDPGSHNGPSSPLPTTVRASILYRQQDSAFSSLVDSRRIVRTHAARRS